MSTSQDKYANLLITREELLKITSIDKIGNCLGVYKYNRLKNNFNIDISSLINSCGKDFKLFMNFDWEALDKSYPDIIKVITGPHLARADNRNNFIFFFDMVINTLEEEYIRNDLNNYLSTLKYEHKVVRNGRDDKLHILLDTYDNDNLNIDFKLGKTQIELATSHSHNFFKSTDLRLNKLSRCEKGEAFILYVHFGRNWDTTTFTVVDTLLDVNTYIDGENWGKEVKTIPLNAKNFLPYKAGTVINYLAKKVRDRQKNIIV